MVWGEKKEWWWWRRWSKKRGETPAAVVTELAGEWGSNERQRKWMRWICYSSRHVELVWRCRSSLVDWSLVTLHRTDGVPPHQSSDG